MESYLTVFQGFLGVLVFLCIPWLLSENRKAVRLKTVVLGIGLQFLLAFLILKISYVQSLFLLLSRGVNALKMATQEGTKFAFGYLGGADLPFALKESANIFIFAFNALPMIIVVSSLAMLLFHWRILPIIVKGFSWALNRTLNVGGALGVCSAAKVFLGQTDAPLLIRPYLADISRSELFTIMTAGMATTSATIMVVYANILENTIPNPIVHILTASLISIPAAITISRLMIPHVGKDTSGELVVPYKFNGFMEAVSQGASDGMKLFLNILAIIIVMLALVALVNSLFNLLPHVGGEVLTLQRIFGWIMAPITWLMGIPWEEAKIAGNLLGTKTVLNEVVAFISLAALPKGLLNNHSSLIMTYALCGFANISSIGFQIGGIGTMAPTRRNEIIELGFRAVLTGTLSSCLSGTIVGILTRF
ncbi:NupC/NupG family nucleoside CNT transporter [Candidatus Nucleicultrix amoebiphila]|uniref:Nucleoside:proton symporter n=1 Tax=Candidatus Nucleicultrix amoebiphila FS5 TaxID=1414854 RepID=A0A1W6N436_9PROT|nr:nucleoside transporter C-terminal domain-containing protein [Candidatus Nucleicultrix amoebiphila]ARN84647.1 nucleoside:proton symporter [Candidatus Nucleicultrix amoebiphila FS5]